MFKVTNSPNTIKPNYYLSVASVDSSHDWINLYIPETLNKHINACVENTSKQTKANNKYAN